MLILTRRVGETIIIEPTTGEKSEVTVLGVKGSHVRVGTQAPTSSLLYANPLNPDSSSHLHHGIVTGEGAMDLVRQCALLTGYGSGNAAAMNQLPA